MRYIRTVDPCRNTPVVSGIQRMCINKTYYQTVKYIAWHFENHRDTKFRESKLLRKVDYCVTKTWSQQARSEFLSRKLSRHFDWAVYLYGSLFQSLLQYDQIETFQCPKWHHFIMGYSNIWTVCHNAYTHWRLCLRLYHHMISVSSYGICNFFFHYHCAVYELFVCTLYASHGRRNADLLANFEDMKRLLGSLCRACV